MTIKDPAMPSLRSVSRIRFGLVADVPENRCVSVAEGIAIVAKVDGEVVAFKNECLHRRSPLAGGLVRDGTLTCPMHFWRYRLSTGQLIQHHGRGLERYPVTIERGVVWVDVPDPLPEPSLPAVLLQHARQWQRDA